MAIKEIHNLKQTDVFYKTEEFKLREALKMFGTDIDFDTNIWSCNLLQRSEVHRYDIKIYFTSIPDKYKDVAKFYSVKCLVQGLSIGSVNNKLKAISKFFNFLEENNLDIFEINKSTGRIFYNYINELRNNNKPFSETYKSSIWTETMQFLRFFNGWENINIVIDAYSKSPFKKQTKKEYKYIPTEVLVQLDEIFKLDNIPYYLKVFYWIARSIPCRATEVLGMKLECLKPYGEDTWVVLIPTWKQNGGHKQEQIRRLYLKYSGHGKFIIDLIKEQQNRAIALQDKVPDNLRGYLFLTNSFSLMGNKFKFKGIIEYSIRDKYIVPEAHRLRKDLNQICTIYNIKESNGNLYSITSHQLRHNGITDRIYAGFTPMEIMLMTAHKNDQMILNSYTHIQKDEIVEKQRIVNEETTLKDDLKVMFRGRILNMDEATESRLLRNKRAYKINNIGICSDITGCKSNIFECFKCQYFVPDAESIDYFKEQIIYWEERVNLYRNNLSLKENAEYNLSLHKEIVNKIELILSEVDKSE